MSDGYFIRKDDKTTCGGVVMEADTRVMIFGMAQSCEGDRVTCGVDGKTYRIEGGVSHVISHGRRVAGTLDSVSGCPCRAQLIASVHTAIYQNQNQASPASHRQSWAAPTGRAADSPPSPAPFTPAGGHDRAYTGELSGDEIEEEEEEVEQEQLITLRLGVFFDGTGNNQANSETVAGCMARDVGLQDMAEELAPGGIAKTWIRGTCLDPIEVNRVQGRVVEKGPDSGRSNGRYALELEPESQAYIDKFGIPYDSW